MFKYSYMDTSNIELFFSLFVTFKCIHKNKDDTTEVQEIHTYLLGNQSVLSMAINLDSLIKIKEVILKRESKFSMR